MLEARSPSLAGVETTVSDAQGVYRFPALRPGRYEITAALQGFQSAKSSDIRLELGQILKVDLTLRVGGVTEAIKVTGDSPLIDVKQNSAGANVQAETIERIPKGRDFAALVTSAPGITSESRNRGIQIDGASGADNRFLIDGVDTTNLLNGTSGKALPAGLRRHRAGQGERLRRGIPRLARRRDQRHHEVGRQRVPRRRAASTSPATRCRATCARRCG